MKPHHIEKPFTLIIFGASGDLAKLKLFPALYDLARQKRLPKEFHIMGFARSKISNTKFRKIFKTSVEKSYKKSVDKKLLEKLIKRVHYFQGQYNKIADFIKLRGVLKTLTNNKDITTLAYFSVPPTTFKSVIENLGKTKKSKTEDIRLILEKPFGEDTSSALDLFHFAARYFNENAVYLLDHYLGKSAVQSILHLRHSNRLLNLMMKGPEIANIQITAFEDKGVKNRIGYFEKVGTIKDMVQSHLLQLLSLVAMSIPISEDAQSLHREKYAILSALKFTESKNNIVLGQYKSYHKEKGVPPTSKTNTFAALRLFIDRESWYKTPIYLRTGKRLHEKHTYVTVEIKKFAFQKKSEEPNRIIFEFQPDEKINIRLLNKQGLNPEYEEVITSQSIGCSGDNCLSEHALLILDVAKENRLHFLSFQEIIATWQITDKILKFIKNNKIKVEKYKDGSKGPKSQNRLTETDNFKWFDIH